MELACAIFHCCEPLGHGLILQVVIFADSVVHDLLLFCCCTENLKYCILWLLLPSDLAHRLLPGDCALWWLLLLPSDLTHRLLPGECAL